MKKVFSICAALLLIVTAACAEEGKPELSMLSGMVFEFSSGVGGWFSELTMGDDGSFNGTFSDSEMGEDGENYPNGTVYGCLFHGSFSVLEQVNAHTWRLSIDELEQDEGQVPEVIEDGIRYVTQATPYGLEDTTEMLLYLKGSPIAELPEGFLNWCHLEELGGALTELPFYGLYNEKTESGFVGDFPFVDMQNPWQESAAEELAEYGMVFGIPDGAEEVTYDYLADENLGEMNFTLNGAAMTARMKPAQEFTDISGMYYNWESEADVTVSGCAGKLYQAKDGETTVSVCMWLDGGWMHSLSLVTENPDQVDMVRISEQTVAPAVD